MTCINRYGDFDEALKLANRTRFGLCVDLVSPKRALFERMLIEARAGIVNWNKPLTGVSSATPYHLSNLKLAAKQGLLKMKALADMGMKQDVLAPQERPHVPSLRKLGFHGDDHAVITQAMRTSPELLSALSSASCMWTANAATVLPSADSTDGRIHFTAANLNNKFHRSIEHETTSQNVNVAKGLRAGLIL